ncbi:MAG: PH domain-containing protein [Syntrophomonadaceae bacterium]
MKYVPRRSNGAFFGTVLGLLVFGLCFWGIGYSLGEDESVLKFLLYFPGYIFLGLYIVLLLGAFNLSYELQDDKLIINWGIRKIHIPLRDITEVIEVKGSSNFAPILGVSWPGYMAGMYVVKGLGMAKMFATRPENGFVYIKTERSFYGITPDDYHLTEILAYKNNKTVEIVDMNIMSEEVKGKSIHHDGFYQLLFKINMFFLAAYALYLGAFFPGSGASRLVVLFLVLAVALFFFNLAQAGRLYHFSTQGGYFLMLISIAVTGIFFILSFSEISL